VTKRVKDTSFGDFTEAPVHTTVRTSFAILAGFGSVVLAISGLFWAQQKTNDAMEQSLKNSIESQSDRFDDFAERLISLQETSYKEADSFAGTFYLLNRAALPQLRVPRPSSVRNGVPEVFGEQKL
jgi:hypothetical protein